MAKTGPGRGRTGGQTEAAIAAYGSSNDETIRRRSLIAHSIRSEYKTNRDLALEHNVGTTTITQDKRAIREAWIKDLQDSGRDLFAEAMEVLNLLRAAAMEGTQSRNWRERDRSIRTTLSIVKSQLGLFGIKDGSLLLGISDEMSAEAKIEVTPEQADTLLELFESLTVKTTETTVTRERTVVAAAESVGE